MIYTKSNLKLIIAALILPFRFVSRQSTLDESIVISKEGTEQMAHASAESNVDIQFEYEVSEHDTKKYEVKEGSLDIDDGALALGDGNARINKR